MAKQRGPRADYVPYGGHEVKAVVNGKTTGLCQDSNGVYYYMVTDADKDTAFDYVRLDGSKC